MKKIIVFLAYNFLAVILLFLISEILVRIFCSQIKPQRTERSIFADSLYYDSSGLVPFSSGKSNGAVIKADRYGFRETSVKIDSSKNSWLILGDSVTMGIGVEADSTFAGILQSSVDSINFLNPSIVGYNIIDYLNVYKYFVIEKKNNFKIKRVLLFWCLNDVYSNVPDVITPGEKIRYLLSDLLVFVRIHSRLYFFLKTLLFDRPRSYFLFDEKYYRPENELFQEAIARIVELNKMCQGMDTELDLILMPYEYQLRKSDSRNFSPQHLMMDALKPSGTKVHNLAKQAIEDNFDKELFLYGDGIHLSNFGHRYVADFVLEKVGN